MSNFIEEFNLLLKAKTKCIWIKSFEEQQVMNDIKNTIMRYAPQMKLISWSYFEGYQEEVISAREKKKDPVVGVGPDAIFQEIIGKQKEGRAVAKAGGGQEYIDKNENIYILKDFHLINNEKILIRALRDVKERSPQEMISYNPIVVISPVVDLPLEHEKLFTIIDYDTPNKEQVETLINRFVEMIGKSNKYTAPTEDAIKRSVDLALGLTMEEIKGYCARSLAQYSTIDDRMFYQARMDLIKKTGILEYKRTDSNMADMGGNHSFKAWVDDIKDTFTEEAIEFGVEKSKGFLGLGVPGTAKTLSAEMISKELGLPLLKFNMSSVMHSHVGQSEKNMANAINIVKNCAPCVLLIDEAEKTLSGTGSSNKTDGGTLMRVVGQLLEFLSSEDSKDIFTIMTSNDVSQLPPELTRSGRLDTMWYFGLPTEEEREEIFKIHFSKTKAQVSDEMISYAANISENLTGAEIKEMVKVVMRKAFKRFKVDNNKDITHDDIDNALKEIIPVYESSKEKIMALEDYARNRARFANDINSTTIDSINILEYDDINSYR